MRGGARRYVQRQDDFGRLRLAMWGGDLPECVYEFEDEVRLVEFVASLESHLIALGWSLLEFFPERRSGTDRRSKPREQERRGTRTGTVLPFETKK
jgi:hypothetical protein